MDLHPGEEIVFEGRPVWRAILSFYITGFVAAVLVGVVVALIASAGLGVVVFLVLFAGVVVVGFVRRMATRYTITTQRLRIQRGLLSKHVQQTRIERVQNVNTDQTFTSRLLRVGTVDFDTAGTDDSDFTFVGVGNPHAVVEAVDRAQREAGMGAGRGDPLDEPAPRPPRDGL
jgi:uncharacterized membrane protein YdbT with pleckstrin-like domain